MSGSQSQTDISSLDILKVVVDRFDIYLGDLQKSEIIKAADGWYKETPLISPWYKNGKPSHLEIILHQCHHIYHLKTLSNKLVAQFEILRKAVCPDCNSDKP